MTPNDDRQSYIGTAAQAALRQQRWQQAKDDHELWTAPEAAMVVGLPTAPAPDLERRLDLIGAVGITVRGNKHYPRFQFQRIDKDRLGIAGAWSRVRQRLAAADWEPEDMLAWALAPNAWLDGHTPASEMKANPDAPTTALLRAIDQALTER